MRVTKLPNHPPMSCMSRNLKMKLNIFHVIFMKDENPTAFITKPLALTFFSPAKKTANVYLNFVPPQTCR